MKLTDRMIGKSNDLKREQEKRRAPYFYEDLRGTEMGMAYDDPPRFINLNTEKSVFDQPDETSINTAKSIFDKTAIFHTKRDEE